MAFTIDRLEASRRLGVSTRTVDRFIQTGRIATKRIGKKVFLDEDDVTRVKEENIGYTPDEYEVIQNDESEEEYTTHLSNFPVPNGYHVDYRDLYEQSQENLEKKDILIQDLSYKL
jgi:excisionase family DNA binding protein